MHTAGNCVSENSRRALGTVTAELTGELFDLLDREPASWREALDHRYAILKDVLAGRVPVVIVPAARMGRDAARKLAAIGVDVVAFGDGDRALHGQQIDGLPVLSPAGIGKANRTHVFLIASTMHDSAIRERLRASGCRTVVPVGYLNHRLPDIFVSREYGGAMAAVGDPANRESIERAFALLGDAASRRVFLHKLAFYVTLEKRHLDDARSVETIYFDRSVYSLGSDESVVDGGAYSGDTLRSFLQQSKGNFRSYIAFEPDDVSFARLESIAAADPARISAVRAGLGQESASARIDGTHGLDARVLGPHEPGGTEIPIVSLDDYFEDRPSPTLIKLDIEGSEAAALVGAAGLLRRATPKLAISAYHYPSDLWTLPLLIDGLSPGSRLAIRHYGREIDDTVCYALPQGLR